MDASADGYGRGEACRALWLGPWWPQDSLGGDEGGAVASTPRGGGELDAPGGTLGRVAMAAAHPLALVPASAVNSNSNSGSLTAPHGPSQVWRLGVE